MRLPWRNGGQSPPGITVLIVSGACCIRGMAPLDERAREVIDQAIAETGAVARVTVMPATTAYFGGIPRGVMAQLVADANQGRMPVPAVLVNGHVVSLGVPTVEQVKAALTEASDGAARTVTSSGGGQ